MISFRSVYFYIILLCIVAALLNLIGVINLSSLEIISYTLLFIGLNIFNNSITKLHRVGVFAGATLFQIGAIAFVFTQFEILGIGRIVIPATLFMLGFSLLLTHLLTTHRKISILLGFIMMTAGVLLVVNRGSTNSELYLSSAYAILKKFWIILIATIVILYFGVDRLKKRNIVDY